MSQRPSGNTKSVRRCALLFACVYLVHAVMPVSIQGDSRWTIPTALSFIHGRGADIRYYAPAIVASGFYEAECVDPDHSRRFPISSLDQCAKGRLYSFSPIGVVIVAVPFVAALEASLDLASPLLKPLAGRFHRPWLDPFLNDDLAGCTTLVENLVSSLFTAGAVAVLYLAALELLPAASALALALIFAFGTLLWSVVSRALWQHSPSVFLNSLLVLVLIRGNYRRGTCIFAGFILGLAFFMRPTNAVPILVIGSYLLWHLRWRALWMITGGLLPTLGFVLLNLHMYGSLLAPFFLPVREGSTSLAFHPAIVLALISNLASPARGLFVFMPFFLFLLIPRIWRERMPASFREMRPWFCGVIALHMLLVATHTDWWGGFSYGPRYLSDILPYLMLLWSPVLPWMARDRRRQTMVIATVIVSALIQFRGARDIRVHQWNSAPVSVNDHTARIWDWSDPPFLRGLL